LNFVWVELVLFVLALLLVRLRRLLFVLFVEVVLVVLLFEVLGDVPEDVLLLPVDWPLFVALAVVSVVAGGGVVVFAGIFDNVFYRTDTLLKLRVVLLPVLSSCTVTLALPIFVIFPRVEMNLPMVNNLTFWPTSNATPDRSEGPGLLVLRLRVTVLLLYSSVLTILSISSDIAFCSMLRRCNRRDSSVMF
jgi:hypothetical protein